MTRLTEETLEAFTALLYERGPSVRELASRLGLDTAATQGRLEALLRAGLIEPVPVPETVRSAIFRNNRGYRLTPAGREAAEASSERRKQTA